MENMAEVYDKTNDSASVITSRTSAEAEKGATRAQASKNRMTATVRRATASVVIAVAALSAEAITVTKTVELIDPNDFVNSCYGSGAWDDSLEWVDDDAWVE